MKRRANGQRRGLWRQLLLRGKVGFLKDPYCVREDTEDSMLGVVEPELRRLFVSPFSEGTLEASITPARRCRRDYRATEEIEVQQR